MIPPKMHIRIFKTILATLEDEDVPRENVDSLYSNYCNCLSELRSHLMNDLDGGAPYIFDGANPILNFL